MKYLIALIAVFVVALMGLCRIPARPTDADPKSKVMEILIATSALNKPNAFRQFLKHIPISADFHSQDAVPDPSIERYFVAQPHGESSFFHAKSEITILSTDENLVRVWVTTKNPHQTFNHSIVLNGIATVDLEKNQLLSLLIPNSMIELELENGLFAVKHFKEDQKTLLNGK